MRAGLATPTDTDADAGADAVPLAQLCYFAALQRVATTAITRSPVPFPVCPPQFVVGMLDEKIMNALADRTKEMPEADAPIDPISEGAFHEMLTTVCNDAGLYIDTLGVNISQGLGRWYNRVQLVAYRAVVDGVKGREHRDK
eukprot:COSAG06_NODE_1936_length_8030_cov_4.318245_3_plen_142_part_00